MKIRLNALFASVGIAAVLLTGCVSSKKYKASQASLQQLRNDSNQLAQQLATVNTNVQTLEQKNTALQHSLDSSSTSYASQQKSLDYYQEYFTRQQGTLSQVSQELTGALTQAGMTNEDIQQENGAIYVRLDENKVFKKNSTAVTSSGKQAFNSLAQVIKNHSDMNVVVSDGDSSSGQSSTTSQTNTTSTGGNESSANNTTADNMSANSTTRHHRSHHMMAHRSSTTSKTGASDNQANATNSVSTKTTSDKTSNVASTHRRAKRKYSSSEGSMTFYNNKPAFSRNKAWALQQGRVNSVANGLLQNGVPKVNLLMQQPNSNGNAQNNSIKVIITPTMKDFNPQSNSSTKAGTK